MEKRSIDCRFRILTAFILIVITGLSGTLIARDRIEEFGLSMDSIVNETNGRVSIQITSADKYDMIYLHNPEEKMIPASITKLITAAVAIDVLGINFDFKTVVYTDDSDIKDGVINGNVYLKGFGDPDLNSSDITYLAKEVVSKGIKEIILLQLRYGNSFTGYNLFFHELQSKESVVLFEDEKVIVKTIPLNHRIYTNGFLFQEKNKERKLNIDKIQNLEIDVVYYQKIKYGGDITLANGQVIPNSTITFEPEHEKTYAFCSDTVYDEQLIPFIEGVDVLYHESTFLEKEMHLAEKTKHSTAKQAATMALKANVKQLVLGHFSTRYESINIFKEEAETIFPNVFLADDGKEFEF